jgi:bifunctional UDP-N-acetylglucosamine pyrophosphorylase/glucosamine-1-phosphate N-acetyltransferase
MPDLHIVVLAAGKGTRMKSVRPKVLHRVAGRPMIEYVLDSAAALNPASTTIIVGHHAEDVERALGGRRGLGFVRQEPQLGTAHALLCAEDALNGTQGDVLLLSGDVPLLTAATLDAVARHHRTVRAHATVVTAVVDDPSGYGRIVRMGEQIARIVEQKDATPEEREIREINAGIYMFALDGLFATLRNIAAANAQNEYYLPDIVAIYRNQGLRVATVAVDTPDEVRGINSRGELAEVGRIVRARKNAQLMSDGVTIEDPATTYVDRDVRIGVDTVIHPGVSLEGTTTVGAGCEIHSGARVVNSRLGDNVIVFNHSVVTDSTVADRARVGPFAHIRQDTTVAEDAKVGNFVEMKKTALGAGSKSMHLTYLGDAVIGPTVNIGAGTITCNYDGVSKQQTTIEEGAFIGSDTQLIAPVTVGKGAYVGTGTTVRENVPAGALAVSAGKQRNLEGWAEERRTKRKK